MTTKQNNYCAICSKVVEKTRYCSNCREAVYCSKDCQVKDWAEHKTTCNNMRDATIRSKKLINEMKGKLIHFGNHFHPKNLKRENAFMVNGTLVSVYSK